MDIVVETSTLMNFDFVFRRKGEFIKQVQVSFSAPYKKHRSNTICIRLFRILGLGVIS